MLLIRYFSRHCFEAGRPEGPKVGVLRPQYSEDIGTQVDRDCAKGTLGVALFS